MECSKVCPERESEYTDCSRENDKCGERNWNYEGFPVAMAYVPMQPWRRIYDLEQGLSRGTIFPDLDLPFLGGDEK